MMEKQLKQTALPCLELWGNLCVCVNVYEMSVVSSNAAVANLALFIYFLVQIKFAKTEWSVWKPAG